MTSHSLPAIFLALAALLTATAPSPGQSLGTDANWIPSLLHPRGVDGDVRWSAVYCGDLYIGGDFQFLGDLEVGGLARWDGTSWHAVPGNTGGGPLAVFDGKLTVVRAAPFMGAYTEIRVSTWDGATWQALPPLFALGTDAEPRAVQAHEGDLVVGGNFAVISLDEDQHAAVRWNGTDWEGLGGSGEIVTDLAVHDGVLVAAWVAATTRIDRLDGSTWTTLGGTFPSEGASPYGFSSLVVHGTDLLAARTGPSTSEYEIRRWNGTEWDLFEGPSPGAGIYDMVSQGTDLYAGTYSEGVRWWNGSRWRTLGPAEMDAYVLAWHQGRVVAGGRDYMAAWDGPVWTVLGDPSGEAPSGHIMAIHSHGGDLVVAGSFSIPGDYRYVAAWDGASWQDLGFGGPDRMQRALTEYDGRLICAGGTPQWVGNVWELGGSSWRHLGGTNNTGTVHALTVYEGNLIAAGTFSELGGVPAGGVAAWDGVSWTPLGAGVDVSGTQEGVWVVTVWNDLLVVGGNFDAGGGSAAIQYLAAWNGTTWSGLEPPGNNPPAITGPVTSLAVFDGDLVAGGFFWSGDEAVASWNGQDWSPLGGGLGSAPAAMTTYQGHLFAASHLLFEAGGIPVNRIAAWDGSAWMAMGSGLTDPYSQFLSSGWTMAEHGGDLWVGGDFRTAGSNVSYHLAAWNLSSSSVKPDPGAGSAALLGPGFPNPFRVTSRMELDLARPGRVRATVFDVLGRPVAHLIDDRLDPGRYLLEWNPRAGGDPVGAGVYFILVRSPEGTDSRRVIYTP